MFFDWNPRLGLGLAGMALAAVLFVVLCILAAIGKRVRAPWWLGLGVLFVGAAVLTISSQVEIISKFSSGSRSDDLVR